MLNMSQSHMRGAEQHPLLLKNLLHHTAISIGDCVKVHLKLDFVTTPAFSYWN